MNRILTAIKENNTAILLMLAVLVLGIVLLVSPTIAGQSLLRVAGLVLFIVGGFKTVRYFRNRADAAVRGWGLSAGALLALGGFVLLLVPDTLTGMMPILFGLLLFTGGVMKFQISFDLKRLNYSKWYVALIFTAASIAFGWITIYHPVGVAAAFMELTGLFLIAEAVLDCITIILFHRQKKRFQASSAG